MISGNPQAHPVNAAAPARAGASRSLKALIAALWLLAPLGLLAIAWLDSVQGESDLAAMAEGGFFIGLAFVLIALVGALAAMGQPRNAVGWMLLSTGLAIIFAGITETWAMFLMDAQADLQGAMVAGWLGGLGWYAGLLLMFLIFPFLYPDGHLAGRRWRPVFALAITAALAIFGVALLAPLFLPTRFELEPIESMLDTLFLAIPVFGLLGVASLVVRYRRSVGDVRLQMKWLLVTVGLPIVVFVLLALAEELLGLSFSNLLYAVMYLAIPVGLGISLLRYRMFDVDTVIRKTAVYGALTILLALTYFGIVIVMQRLLTPVTGQSTVSVVLSTLLIAALFLPLRRRVQDVIDRRFYRRKYDAEKVLAAFAATARDETDLDALTAELIRVIQETMQPESVSIWLRDANPRSPESAQPPD